MYVYDNCRTESKDIVETINELFSSMQKKKHIVYADKETLRILQKCESLDRSWAMMAWIEKHYLDLRAVERKVYFTVVLITGDSYFDGKTYFLCIDSIKEFYETQCLTENDEDFVFYQKIYNFMYADLKLVGCCLQNNPFYGGNVANRIDWVKKENKFFICIVDSDKDYKGGAFGSTYHSAKTAMDHPPADTPQLLYVLKVREKENLLPFHLYNPECLNQKCLISCILKVKDEEFLRFVKIKSGYKLKNLTGNNNFLLTKYNDFFEMCKKVGIYTSVQNEDDYCIKGISANLLSQTIKTEFAGKSYKQLQNAKEIDNFFGKQQYIIEEWKEIASILFDFGCCLSKDVNFLT